MTEGGLFNWRSILSREKLALDLVGDGVQEFAVRGRLHSGREVLVKELGITLISGRDGMTNSTLGAGLGGVMALANLTVEHGNLIVEDLGFQDHDLEGGTDVVVALQIGTEAMGYDVLGCCLVDVSDIGTAGYGGGSADIIGYRNAGEFTVQELLQSVELCVVHSGDLTNEV